MKLQHDVPYSPMSMPTPQGQRIKQELPGSPVSTANDGSTPLLRQVLMDKSFEAKFDVKVNFGMQVKAEVKSEPETVSASLEEVKMDPVISLAMEQVKKDIETTSQILRISPGKYC